MIKDKALKRKKRKKREQADPDIEANIEEFKRLLAKLSDRDKAKVLVIVRRLLDK
jgi:hypothetical protein